MRRIVGLLAAALIGVAALSMPLLAEPAPKAKGPVPALPSNQFASENEARTHCRTETVVWVNLSSRIYHLAGTRDYGKTRRGAYMCRAEADSFGFRGVRSGTPAKKKTKNAPKGGRK